jgi:hypothetical protein
MLSAAAAQHRVSGILAEMPLVAVVGLGRARISVQLGRKGLLGGGHYGCNLYGFALQHVCGPAGVWAHTLQSSAQLSHPGVGAAAPRPAACLLGGFGS